MNTGKLQPDSNGLWPKTCKKGSLKYIGDKTEVQKSVDPLLNEAQDLLTQDREKA